jgi:hypothetical protein
MVKKIAIHNHFYDGGKKSAIQKKKAEQKSYWNHSKRELHRKHLKRVCSTMEASLDLMGLEKAYRNYANYRLEEYFTKFQGPLNITPNTIALSIAYIVYWLCDNYDEFSKLVHIKEITLNKAAKILEPKYFKD